MVQASKKPELPALVGLPLTATSESRVTASQTQITFGAIGVRTTALCARHAESRCAPLLLDIALSVALTSIPEAGINASQAQVVVTAWNDNEIRTVPVHWEER